MGKYLSHSKRNIYHAVIIIWSILTITVLALIVTFDLQRSQTLFKDKANLHYQTVNDRVHIIESILEGFAAMVSVTHDLGTDRIRRYAKTMLEQYPHIFMFEIVEKVPHKQMASFAEYYRDNIYPDFQIRAFSYEGERQWTPVNVAPYHLPIVFMEPFSEQSRKVLGIDLGSNEFFMRTMRLSEMSDNSVASDPFTLVEGHLAYIVHRPIPGSDERIQPYSIRSGAEDVFAALVILADSLLDEKPLSLRGMRVLLHKATYGETDPKGRLYLRESAPASWFEELIFPRLRVNMMLDSVSQPFVLLVEHQLGWGIISWDKLGLTLFLALLSFWVMMIYARLYFRHEMARADRYLQIAKAIIVGLDRKGNVNLINRRGCEILGYSEKEILGRNWFETVLPDENREAVLGVFRNIMSGEMTPMSKYENEVIAKNGERRFIDWTNDIETNQKGEIIGTLSSGQDISERKRAEEDAKIHHRDMAHVMRLSTMGEMATGMAHELNQPLTALISYCGTARSLANSLPSPSQKLDNILARASEQAHRAAGIIRHLREFVSKDNKQRESFELDRAIQDIIAFLKWEVQESGVEIEFHPGGQSGKIRADKIQIEQVLVNLVWNSLEAIGQAKTPNGRIVIQTRLLPIDRIEVTVRDNGPGIQAAMVGKIFEQFQTSKKTGMGIGLSLSRTIIDVHGGKLWVDQNYKGGALFGFELPMSR